MALQVECGKQYETENGYTVRLRRNALPHYCFSASATNGIEGDDLFGEKWTAGGIAYHDDCGYNLVREVPDQ